MSRKMIVRPNQLPVARKSRGQVKRELERQTEQMAAIAEAAKCAIREVSETTAFCESETADTFEIADYYRQQTRRSGCSPAREAVYESRDQEYLRTMYDIAATANAQIVLCVDQAGYEGSGGAISDFIDGLLGR